ncbi:MAG: hypothetical protein ACREOQ_14450 [Gemmatimonadales bacterium]
MFSRLDGLEEKAAFNLVASIGEGTAELFIDEGAAFLENGEPQRERAPCAAHDFEGKDQF